MHAHDEEIGGSTHLPAVTHGWCPSAWGRRAGVDVQWTGRGVIGMHSIIAVRLPGSIAVCKCCMNRHDARCRGPRVIDTLGLRD